MAKMKQVVLRSRPQGNPRPGDFAVETAEIPTAGPGQLLVRTLFLSLDPYMRFGLDEKPLGGANGVALGAPLIGDTVCEVVASESPDFAQGALLLTRTRWSEYNVVSAAQPAALRKLSRATAPLSAALGVLGMPGQTAYAGMVNIARVKAGDKVIVSAAAGAVGSLAGQIGRILGAQVIGIAGGPEKCRAVEQLGFDACVDYKAPDFDARLAALVPGGADVYFENVGGAVTRTAVPLLKYGARVPMCGFISQYGTGEIGAGPDQLPWFLRMIMLKGLEVRGFAGAWVGGEKALQALQSWLQEGKLRTAETVVDGLQSAPQAFSDIFQSNRHVGKLVVRVAD
jgi:NADPH-dependent curcumin reductase